MNRNQIQTISAHHFLTLCHVVPSLKMATLNHSIRAVNDVAFKLIQQMERYNHTIFEE